MSVFDLTTLFGELAGLGVGLYTGFALGRAYEVWRCANGRGHAP